MTLELHPPLSGCDQPSATAGHGPAVYSASRVHIVLPTGSTRFRWGSSRRLRAHPSRRPFARPPRSLRPTSVVPSASLPPVLHGGSAAPPASPPRGPVSELCAFHPASPLRDTARSSRASSSHPSPSPATQLPDHPGRLPIPSALSLSHLPAPLPNPGCSGLAALAAEPTVRRHKPQ